MESKIKKMNFYSRKSIIFLLLIVLSACKKEEEYQTISGFTMGTSYNITLRIPENKRDQLGKKIDSELTKINQLMSTYISNSELSRFNQSKSLVCQPISPEMYYVIKNAVEVSQMTNGKFDVTLFPLISEWGFDKKKTENRIPSETAIQDLLEIVGYDKIRIGDSCIQKTLPQLSINLSAIAKGFAVDHIAKIIEEENVKNYLVEIGGETASKGNNPHAVSWRLAIEAPSQTQRKTQQAFMPKELGVATSGDYRNYFEKDGIRFSHTIDPTTGRPIRHKLISVTVLHEQTMLADAYATAFMVMGVEKTLEFAEQHKLPVF